jgi:hypothetical protein
VVHQAFREGEEVSANDAADDQTDHAPMQQRTTSDAIEVLGDDPIASPDEDLLGRRDFAARIADVIIRTSIATDSAVFGLLGPWGSGKTSLITVIESELTKREDSWKVVRFNPWELSDLQSLIVEFLASIRSALPTKGRGAKEAFADLARRVAPYTGVLKIANLEAEGAVNALAEQLEGTVANRREELAKLLRELKQPILLFVDDVDRLHPDELTTLFKLVRLVGRLPHVHYLLAFDEETIVDVLQQTGLAHGEEERALRYLEKVVQIRFDVPQLHPKRVTGLVSRLFEQTAESHGIELQDDDVYRLSGPFNAHMVTKLQQPREIKRLWAQIEALYPLVAENVDFIDFVMVTFLRTSHHRLFQALPRHRAALTGTEFDMSDAPREQRLERWRQIITDAGVPEAERAGVLELLAVLFVPIQQSLANMSGHAEYEELAQRHRVGSHLYFDWYFHLGLGPDDVPDAALAAAVHSAEDGPVDEAVAAILPALTSDAEGTLDRMRLVLPREPERLATLAGFLAAIARLTPPNAGLLGRARIVAGGFVKQALRAAAVVAKTEAALDDIARHGSYPVLANTAAAIVCDREKQDHDLFDAGALARSSAERIRARVEELGRMSVEEAGDRDLLVLLYRWGDLPGDDGPRTWLERQVRGQWDVRDVVGLFVPIATSQGSGAPRKRLAELSTSSLASLLPLEEVIDVFAGGDPVDDATLWKLEKDVSFAGRVAFARAVLTNMWHERNRPHADGVQRATAGDVAVEAPEACE